MVSNLFQQYLSCLVLGLPGVVVASYMGNNFKDMKTAFERGDIEDARKHQVSRADQESFIREGPI